MSSITMKPGGEIALPHDLRERYRLTPDIPIRVIETQTGILLVPLSQEPMVEELAKEIADWQALGTLLWEKFSYSKGLDDIAQRPI